MADVVFNSWDFYDDFDDDYGTRWTHIEQGEVDLHKEGVPDIYETIIFERLPELATDANSTSAKTEGMGSS